MKSSLLFLFILAGFSLKAQNFGPEVLSTSGGNYSNGVTQFTYTLGETFTDTYTTSDNILTQGFEQPEYYIVTAIEKASSEFQISVFPNPASEFLKINFNKSYSGLSYQLLDINSKLLISESLVSNEAEINLIQFSNASYALIILQAERQIASYKIIKTN